MKQKKTIVKWNHHELAKLETFIKQNSKSFYQHFYKNILNPIHQVRKEPRIFIRMEEFVGKTTKQCKSKFQKYDRTIYLDHLNIPIDHYQVFLHIQNKKRRNCQLKIKSKNSADKKSKYTFNFFFLTLPSDRVKKLVIVFLIFNCRKQKPISQNHTRKAQIR
jgi:hypothetical protein